MNVREFIAKNNTDGVVKFAAEQGIAIPSDPAVAYDFLTQAYNQDPMLVFSKIKELHPHAAVLNKAFDYGNKHNGCDCDKCKVKRRFKNFTDEDVDTYMDEAGNIFDKGVQRGRDLAQTLFGGIANNNSNANNNNKDHSKEMLIYLALIFGGAVVGYAFAKK